MSEAPRVDILLRRAESEWTEEQKARLPDGVRHSKASHLGGQSIMRTPEEILEIGRQWATQLVRDLPAQEVLSYYKPQERLAGLKPQERVAGLKPQERLAGLSASDIRAYLEQLEAEQAVNGH